MATADKYDAQMQLGITQPIDLLRISIDMFVLVKMRNNRELRGKLHAFDLHLNMILSDCEETVTSVDIDSDLFEGSLKTTKRNIAMLFVRGDGVIMISPLVSERS
ncbi:hypothetical protein ACOME3_008475 [Neoechinorhynchus agilis]